MDKNLQERIRDNTDYDTCECTKNGYCEMQDLFDYGNSKKCFAGGREDCTKYQGYLIELGFKGGGE